MLFGGGDGVVEIDCLGDVENAESGEVVDTAVDVADGFGEDDFFEVAGSFVEGEDGFAIESIFDFDHDDGVAVGVAAVFDDG